MKEVKKNEMSSNSKRIGPVPVRHFKVNVYRFTRIHSINLQMQALEGLGCVWEEEFSFSWLRNFYSRITLSALSVVHKGSKMNSAPPHLLRERSELHSSRPYPLGPLSSAATILDGNQLFSYCLLALAR